MFRSFHSFIAARYLRSKRKEVFISIITVISVLGVALSVVVLDIALSIMDGFEGELQKKLVDTSAHIILRRFGGDIDDPENLIQRISAMPGVESSQPYSYNQAMMSVDQAARGLLIRGIADNKSQVEKLDRIMSEGAPVSELFRSHPVQVERPDGIIDEVLLPPLIVGRALRNKLGLQLGQPVTLLSPQLTASPRGLIPRLKRFVVVGIYQSGLVEYEEGLAYTSLDEAQRFFSMGNSVTGIEVQLIDMFKAEELSPVIIRELGEAANGLYATDWKEPNRALWEALKLEKRVYFYVLLLLVLIASFSIVSTLVMVVMEKSKDVALLKTMGASDRDVTKIFLIQGSVIGFVGTVLGTILGYLGCLGLRAFGFPIDPKVFSLTEVPVYIIEENFLIVALAAFVISSLAGIYPALRAARLRPAEVLRYE